MGKTRWHFFVSLAFRAKAKFISCHPLFLMAVHSSAWLDFISKQNLHGERAIIGHKRGLAVSTSHNDIPNDLALITCQHDGINSYSSLLPLHRIPASQYGPYISTLYCNQENGRMNFELDLHHLEHSLSLSYEKHPIEQQSAS
jgi:hypothetical protein